MIDDELTEAIIGAAYAVHNKLGSGFLEKVYGNALAVELKRRGFRVRKEHPITVYYENEIVGEFRRPAR
jgi:GxxExxY protein